MSYFTQRKTREGRRSSDVRRIEKILTLAALLSTLSILGLLGFATLDGDRSKWLSSPTYQILNAVPGIEDGSDRRAIIEAVEAWGAVTGTSLNFSEVQREGDITIESLDRWPQELAPEAAGVTFTYRERGEISRAEILLNAQFFSWSTQPVTLSHLSDVGGVITHELGHALGLTHSFYREATMYWSGGEVALRSLDEDDERGLRFLYGGVNAGRMCDTCTTDADCRDGLCLLFDNDRGYCGEGCAEGCPTHADCYELNTGDTSCAPLALTCDDAAIAVAQEGEYCFGAAHCVSNLLCIPSETDAVCTPLGQGQLGDECAFNDFCASGLCLPLTEHFALCSEACDPSISECALGGLCFATGDADPEGLCLPPGDAQIGAVCDDVAMRCAPDLTCAYEPGGRVCRHLCEPYGFCPEDLACTPIMGRWRCEPLEGPQEGAACDPDCGGGLYCYGGVCLIPCDPNRADACGGDHCRSVSGLGVCSSGEALLGEPCVNDLDCADFICEQMEGERVCLTHCDRGQCPEGWVCEMRSSESVCISGLDVPTSAGVDGASGGVEVPPIDEPDLGGSPRPQTALEPTLTESEGGAQFMVIGASRFPSSSPSGCRQGSGHPAALLGTLFLIGLLMRPRRAYISSWRSE